MRGPRHRTHRRAYAALAALLWLLGVEVLPNLHLAAHEHDHTHEAGGTIVVVTFDETHTHADGTAHAHHAEASHDHDAPARDRDRLAIDDVPPPGHAAGGIAHHALALHQPAPPLLAPIAVPRAEWWAEARPIARPHTIDLSRPTARGPPVA